MSHFAISVCAEFQCEATSISSSVLTGLRCEFLRIENTSCIFGMLKLSFVLFPPSPPKNILNFRLAPFSCLLKATKRPTSGSGNLKRNLCLKILGNSFSRSLKDWLCLIMSSGILVFNRSYYLCNERGSKKPKMIVVKLTALCGLRLYVCNAYIM